MSSSTRVMSGTGASGAVGRRALRRRFLGASMAAAALGADRALGQGGADKQGSTGSRPPATSLSTEKIVGSEHWATKRAGDENVRLFMWRKTLARAASEPSRATILFVHGSSTAGKASFDLQVPGKPQYSAMDYFARRGYDTWCLDHEGYGRSDKKRPVNFDVATGADDLAAASDTIQKVTGARQLLIYGISSGALRAGLFAQRQPGRVQRLALDALVWTGEGSRTLAERRKHVDQWRAHNRRPLTRKLVESIFTRDHPGTADPEVVKVFADTLLAQDNSVPTGTYLDMCVSLPILDPARITMPTMIMRGQFDGIATMQDVLGFFERLPNPDKQFAMQPGIAHSSLHEKNVAIVLHTLDAFFSEPAPVYLGGERT